MRRRDIGLLPSGAGKLFHAALPRDIPDQRGDATVRCPASASMDQLGELWALVSRTRLRPVVAVKRAL
jgi:hypothetical protein